MINLPENDESSTDSLRILIVEDNLGDARLTMELLKEISIEIVSVDHVTALAGAVERLTSLKYDLALVDLSLSDSFGVATVESCLKSAPDLPIIVLTGSDSTEIALEAMQIGAQDYIYKGDMDASNLERLIQYAIERKTQETKIKQTARTDDLTGFPNRRCVMESLERMHNQASRSSSDIAVFFVDLDGFKLINDTLGHQAGNLVLIEVAKRIDSCLRGGDFFGRLGGDEFAVILHADKHTPLAVAHAASRILQNVIAPIQLEVEDTIQAVKVACSIGIAVKSDVLSKGQSPEGLLNQADTAMYKAKEGGGNDYRYYNLELEREAKSRMKFTLGLSQALERDEYSLVYQPILDAETGDIRGVETLLRWNSAGGDQISPSDFIPVLEESYQIVSVGYWVLENACREYRELVDQKLMPADTWISINFSPKQFGDPNLVRIIKETIDRYQLPENILCLEITETTMMDNTESIIERMHLIKNMGVMLAIDDFGSGFSSMAYLKLMPVDYLKIDSSFIFSYSENDLDRAVTKAMIGLAEEFGLGVISEGIEDRVTADLLIKASCSLQQGYFHARPMDYDKLSNWLDQRAYGNSPDMDTERRVVPESYFPSPPVRNVSVAQKAD